MIVVGSHEDIWSEDRERECERDNAEAVIASV